MASFLRSRASPSAPFPIAQSIRTCRSLGSNGTVGSRLYATNTRFLPPDPTGLPRYKPPRYPRLTAFAKNAGRRLAITTAVGTGLYYADAYFNYSTFSRNLRTLWVAILISGDYKLNFRPNAPAEKLSAIHERTADRILNLCFTNGGLYQKMGQAIAMQTAALPPIFQKKFRMFFDETPQAGYAEIAKILKEEYAGGKAQELFGVKKGGWEPEDLFMPGTFQRRAVGSASVAQVHKAQLKTGEWVAVKIQKPGISRQVYWDLAIFK
jgi:aarF domain-containing kinase